MTQTTRTSTVTRGRLHRVAARPRLFTLSRHSFRFALGVMWLLDGALQLQSFMFTTGFARTIIAPAARGQPFFVAGPVEWNARMIAAHPVVLDGVFASIQLALGLWLLFGRIARAALVSSIMWAAGVWYLGEGLGGLAGGHVTALVGAPGAALLYVVVALAAWPSSSKLTSNLDTSRRSSPPYWLLRVWTALWVTFVVLNLLPTNVSWRTVSTQLTTNASMVPGILAAIDRGVASLVRGGSNGAVVLIVALELAIGLLVLRGGVLRTVALWAGVAMAGLYWGAGQSFGQLFSGQATDPNSGPLLILLGLAALGVARRADEPRAQIEHIVQTMRPSQETAA